MRRFALALALGSIGCGATTFTPDMAVSAVEGCRVPRACWLTSSCSCLFQSYAKDCRLCDPSTFLGNNCVCSDYADAGTVACVESTEVCVGRGPSCPGVGALCLRVGQSCGTGAGDPPELVPAASDPDAGGSLEPHCTFVDDVCCPGTAPPDAAMDLAAPFQD